MTTIKNLNELDIIYNQLNENKIKNVVIIGKTDYCPACKKYVEILKNIDNIYYIDYTNFDILYKYKEDFSKVPFTIVHKDSDKDYWFESGVISEDLIKLIFEVYDNKD